MNEQLRMAIPVLWPAMAAAGAILLVAWWPRWDVSGAPLTPSTRGWAGALGLGLAFTSAFVIIAGGMPAMPFREKWHWLLPICGAATGFGVAAGVVERSVLARWGIGLACAAAAGLLLHPPLSIENPQEIRVGMALATLIAWLCIDASARRNRGFSTPLLLAVMFGGLSLVIMAGHNANFSLLTASMAATLAVAAAIALVLPPLCLANGGSHVAATLLIALIATARMYGVGDPMALFLVTATPLVLRIAEVVTERRSLKPWKAFLIRAICVTAVVGLAVVIAMIAAARQPRSDYGV